MTPIAALFLVTIRQTLLSRKIWLSVAMLAAPCALHMAIRLFGPRDVSAMDLWQMYHVKAHFFLMSTLVPLVCMVYGSSLISSEVENRTITYLVTRRLRRATVLIVKFVATAIVLTALCAVAMIGLHYCVLFGRDVPTLLALSEYGQSQPASDLYHYLTIIPLTVVGFLAVFTLISMVTARALIASCAYFIVAELIVSNLLVIARRYTLLHQIRVTTAGLMPSVRQLFELPADLAETLYPEGATALPELLCIVSVAVALAAILMTICELTPSNAGRD